MGIQNNDNRNGNKNDNNKKPSGGGIFFLLFLLLIGFFAFTWIFRLLNPSTAEEVTYSEFLKMVENKKIDSIVIEDTKIDIYPVGTKQEIAKNWLLSGGNQKYYYTGKAEDDASLTKRMLEAGVEVKSEIPSNTSQIWYIIFVYVLPTVLFIVFAIFLIRRMSKGGGIGGLAFPADPADQAVEPDRLLAGDNPLEIFRIKFPLEDLCLKGIDPHGVLDGLTLGPRIRIARNEGPDRGESDETEDSDEQGDDGGDRRHNQARPREAAEPKDLVGRIVD